MSLVSTSMSQCPFASSPSSPPISPSTSVSFIRANIPAVHLASSPPSYPIPASLPIYPRSHINSNVCTAVNDVASSPPSITELSVSPPTTTITTPSKPPLYNSANKAQTHKHQHKPEHSSPPSPPLQPYCYFYLSTRQQNTIERIIESTKNKKQETKKIYGNVVEYVTNKLLDNGIYIQFIRGTPITCIFNSQDIGTISLQRTNKFDYAYPIYNWQKIQRFIAETSNEIFFLRIEEENDGVIDYYKLDAFDTDGNLLFPICFTLKEHSENS